MIFADNNVSFELDLSREEIEKTIFDEAVEEYERMGETWKATMLRFPTTLDIEKLSKRQSSYGKGKAKLVREIRKVTIFS